MIFIVFSYIHKILSIFYKNSGRVLDFISCMIEGVMIAGRMRVALLSALAVISTAASPSAHASTLYYNNFNSGKADGFSYSSITTSPSGEKFFGPLYNGRSTTLTLSGLEKNSQIYLTFDIYALMSVDGNGPAGYNSPSNPDSFTVSSGSSILWRHALANKGWPDTQDYPVPGSPPESGAVASNTLGYYADSIYNVSVSAMTNSQGSVSFTFTGQTNQALTDEFFGFDNVTVTNTRPVPEPIALGTVGAGFLGMGIVCRRKKQRSR
ncbi:MAG: hypothetical protein F8N37_21855 [Telmatospirillum sp.]|nr:hypothetical protein [Telmatospirillum sp.]